VVDVHPEVLGDITDEGAVSEGVDSREAFIALWESLHGGGAWERDRARWVWVLRFSMHRSIAIANKIGGDRES
jgi:hypothetical protein